MAVGDDKMRINLSLTKELNWLLETMAEEDGRSKNSLILVMIYEALRNSKQVRDLLYYIDDKYTDYNSYKNDRRLVRIFRTFNSEEENNEKEDEERFEYRITSISTYLRRLTVEWSDKCKQEVNYTCQLTKKHSENLNTHHLYAFRSIVIDAHNTYNIKIKPQVKDYTKEELKLLEEYVAEWHKDNSNAIVLSEEVHRLFHRPKNEGGYGSRNNTPEQFKEFKQRYLNGEFDNLLGDDLDD